MPFCSNCGSQITVSSKFCSNCGAQTQPVAPPQPQYQTPAPQPTQPVHQPPPAVNNEPILGVIDRCKHGIPANTFALFFTNRRIIAAKIGGIAANFSAAAMGTAGLVGLAIGAGIEGTMSGGMTKKTYEYYQMTPDQMLLKDKKNIEIPLTGVQSIEMKKPGMLSQGEIKIKTPWSNLKFFIEVSKEDFNQCISIVQRTVPGRVFIK